MIAIIDILKQYGLYTFMTMKEKLIETIDAALKTTEYAGKYGLSGSFTSSDQTISVVVGILQENIAKTFLSSGLGSRFHGPTPSWREYTYGINITGINDEEVKNIAKYLFYYIINCIPDINYEVRARLHSDIYLQPMTALSLGGKSMWSVNMYATVAINEVYPNRGYETRVGPGLFADGYVPPLYHSCVIIPGERVDNVQDWQILPTPIILLPVDDPISTVSIFTITCEEAGTSIYYTTNGETPTIFSPLYMGPFAIPEAGEYTIMAVATKYEWYDSLIADSGSLSVLEKLPTPVITLPVPPFSAESLFAIACDMAEASIYYTTDGVAPTEESLLYTTPFTMDVGEHTIQAIAILDGYANSNLASEESISVLETLRAPVIKLPQEPYTLNSMFTLASDDEVPVYYTTNGDDPTAESTPYTGPFNMSAGMHTIKAIAIEEGWIDSPIAASAELLVYAPPEAPVALESTNILDTGFTASWKAVDDALKYLLDVSTDSEFKSYVAGYKGLEVYSTSQAVTSLEKGVDHYYRVRAESNGGIGVNSNTITTVLTQTFDIAAKLSSGSTATITIRLYESMTLISTGDVEMASAVAGPWANSLSVTSSDKYTYGDSTPYNRTVYIRSGGNGGRIIIPKCNMIHYFAHGTGMVKHLSGSITGMPLRYLNVNAAENISGSVTGMPLTALYCQGVNAVSGDISRATKMKALQLTNVGKRIVGDISGMTQLVYIYINASFGLYGVLSSTCGYILATTNSAANISGNISEMPLTTLYISGPTNGLRGDISRRHISYLYLEPPLAQVNNITGSINGKAIVTAISLASTGSAINITSPTPYAATVDGSNIFTTSGNTTFELAEYQLLFGYLAACTYTASTNSISINGADSFADTRQGGIWGTFSGSPAAPSQLAIDLKTTWAKMQSATTKTLTLKGCNWTPGVFGGFPMGFEKWWNSK